MTEINRGGLERLDTRRNGKDESGAAAMLRTGDPYGPSVRILQRNRQAYNIEALNQIGRFDPDNISMKQRRLMRRDTMIRLGLHYRKVTLVNAPWKVECDDPQVAEFDQRALEAIWARLMVQMLTALDFAYANIVVRFQREIPDWEFDGPDGPRPVWPDKTIQAVTWNTPRILPPWGAEPKFNRDGFVGFEHAGLSRDENDNRPVFVPVPHALWVTNEKEESFGDWKGYPATGYAYRYWWSYWYNWLLADRHMEQDADPPLVVKYPPGSSADPDDPTKSKPNAEIAMRAGLAVRDGATIGVPSTVYMTLDDKPTSTPMWDLKFLTGGENMKAFESRFEYLDVLKLRSMLAPEQALVEGAKATGARNVASTQLQAFVEANGILMGELLQLVNDYLIPPLNKQNFVDPPPAKVVTDGFREEDLSLVNDILLGIAQRDPEALMKALDLRKLAERAGLDVVDEEAWRSALEEDTEAVDPSGLPIGAEAEEEVPV